MTQLVKLEKRFEIALEKLELALANKNLGEASGSIDKKHKDRKIETTYNQMTISLNSNFDVIFRAYNDGVAYRIYDKRNKPKNVIYEKMSIDFRKGASTYFPWEESMYSHNERLYKSIIMHID